MKTSDEILEEREAEIRFWKAMFRELYQIVFKSDNDLFDKMEENEDYYGNEQSQEEQ